MIKHVAELKRKFHELYGGSARIYRAPGRVNLIGEHTDYNNGFVMPAAIDRYAWIAIAPREDRTVHVLSENFSESASFSLDELDARSKNHWSDYVRGVASVLELSGHALRGANILIESEIPIGGGLGSSAAIQIATGLAILGNAGRSIDRVELAELCRRAENEFAGTRCGIMDLFISACGREGQALMLDCRSLNYRLLPLPDGVKPVVCNTMVKHELADSQYNARRAECEEGVRHLAGSLPGLRTLRDVTMTDLERFGSGLPDEIHRRCLHVISENIRVENAAAALERGDLKEFGRLMAGSHRSLRDDYEVSCSELDIMVELARGVEGVYGARMTGGGFGGCAINLVKADSVAGFERFIKEGYERATGITPEIYTCTAAGGAEELTEY